ncbi:MULTISPECIES: oligosaccharide flippase family protein [Alphaproteobacteria]|uniref:Lipopolysaccharide biosynthesis protein n=1 Tax=Sphingomonas psychrolutea TaxID=1259676 RepID=A0ABQ6EGC3_9SPHN|nr:MULTISPECIES: oligosaccharide flippase family protein [Alphaproteobacteria]GLR24025.1 lipopolysaccharide biosynthesis protein [Ciceribacter naphthalenivorans]GLT06881.1 lipopolysaccharide biosynthesis protein [Sphingomonas psychrolutea]
MRAQPRPRPTRAGVWWTRLRLALVSPSLVGSAVWTFGAKVFSQVAQLAAFVVAARVLTSAEFGLFAYSAAFAVLLVIFAEGGWGEFVMKTHNDAERLDQIATVSILSGMLSMTVGLCGATIIGLYFGQIWEAVLVALFSVWLLPASLVVVYEGIMVAAGRLRAHATVRILADACGLAVTVAGLLAGWSVLALVAGRLAMQLTMLTACMTMVRWLPKPRLTRALLWELLDFSRHIVSNRLIVFVRSYSGTLIVGSFLGLADAGYYRAAERIVAAFSEMIGEPLRLLAWVILRRVSNLPPGDRDVSREIGTAATGFMVSAMAVSLPVYIGLALMSGSVVHIVLGEAWAPAAILITLLSVKQILLIPGYLTEPLLSLAGTIRKMPAAVLLNSLVSLAFVLALTPFGMLAAAAGQCAAAMFSFIISMRLQSRYGAVDWSGVLRRCLHPVLGVSAMVTTVALIGQVAESSAASGLAVNMLQAIAGGAVYVVTLAALQKINGGSPPIFAFAQRTGST